MALADFEQLLKAVDGAGRRLDRLGGDRARRAGAAVGLRPRRIRHAYWERVRGSRAELQALIEAVVVPETWFFRDREAFAALARLAREEWLPSAPQTGCCRLLSLPCSTGEEPYSMAMALLDAGVPADRFRIDAVDISAAALAQAERARVRKEFLSRRRAGIPRPPFRRDAGRAIV